MMQKSDLNIYIRLSLLRDKEIISEPRFKDNIAGVVIEPHTFELFSNAISSYLAQNKLQYFIDMSLHKFMINVYESYSAKPWYNPLKEKLGLPLNEEKPYLNPSYISSEDKQRIAGKSLEYQISYVPTKIRSVLGLMNFFGAPREEVLSEPSILVAPYLVMVESLILDEGEVPQLEELLQFNVDILREFKRSAMRKGITKPVMGVVALDKEVLSNEDVIREIIERYLEQRPEYIGIWVSGLDEYDNSKGSLSSLVNLLKAVKEMCDYDIKIINLYSGFFSLILNSLGFLNGIVHGVLHSETRRFDVIVTGAIPRFYVDFLHRALGRASLLLLFKGKVPEDCGSPVCREFIRKYGRLDNIYMHWRDLARHFMYVRLIKEKSNLADKNIDDIIGLLKRDILKTREFSDIESSLSRHLGNWLEILQGLKGNL